MPEKIQPPIAKIIPKKLDKFGDVRIDNYFWLNDRKNPEVIDYLNKENTYYKKMTAHRYTFGLPRSDAHLCVGNFGEVSFLVFISLSGF